MEIIVKINPEKTDVKSAYLALQENKETIVKEFADSLARQTEFLMCMATMGIHGKKEDAPPGQPSHGVEEPTLTLTAKEAHCIARLLQGPLCGTPGHSSILEGCGFCKYRCFDNDSGNIQHLGAIKEKLMKTTGVDLSPRQYGTLWPDGFPYKKFLQNANDDVKEFCRKFFVDV